MTARPAAGPPPLTAWLVRPDGARIWYERWGSDGSEGPTVVLCPPGGRNAEYWSPALLVALAERGGVVRFDWRGQGRSSWDRAAGDAEVLVDDLLALCDELGAASPAGPPLELVGVGLGGWVALRAAQRQGRARRPIGGVSVIGTSGWYADPRHRGPTEPTVVALVLRRRSAPTSDLVRLIGRELRAERSPAEVAELDASAEVRAAHRAEVQRWFEHGFNPDDDHRVAWLAAGPLATDAPPGFTVRVLHGSDDPVVPSAHGHRLAASLGVGCTEVAGAGHHVGPAMEAALLASLRLPRTPRVQPAAVVGPSAGGPATAE